DRAPAIELAASVQAELFQLTRLELLGLEVDVADATVRVEPPPGLEEPPFVVQPSIKRCARERDQVIERGQEQLVLAGEVHTPLYDLTVIVVVAEDERTVNRQAVLSKGTKTLGVAAPGEIPALSHIAQVVRVERLHPDQYAQATTLDHEVQELGVPGNMDTRLANPVDLQGDQRPAKRPGLGRLADDVVVHDKEA